MRQFSARYVRFYSIQKIFGLKFSLGPKFTCNKNTQKIKMFYSSWKVISQSLLISSFLPLHISRVPNSIFFYLFVFEIIHLSLLISCFLSFLISRVSHLNYLPIAYSNLLFFLSFFLQKLWGMTRERRKNKRKK